MTLTNKRRQVPVGQGFFHTASLRTNDGRLLRYVYDCGAMQTYATSREAGIDAYLSHVGAKTRLDLLFVSHVHADHINGIERLLDPTRGLVVDTIVLPLVDDVDRLIAYARTAAEDAGSLSAFYRDFAMNPRNALGRFNPRQVLFVRSGPRGDGGAPGFDGEPVLGGPDTDISGPPELKGSPGWKLVGRGGVVDAVSDEIASQTASDGFRAAVVSDHNAIGLNTSAGFWLLAPFVDQTIASHRADFLRSLARRRHTTVKALKTWLSVSNNLRILLTTDLGDLKGAYEDVDKNLNVTSMSLYSGPAPFHPRQLRRAQATLGRVHHQSTASSEGRIAWLATGDAAFKQTARYSAFTRHYGALLDEVMTLNLPHHGSDHNFTPDLLDDVRPNLCVASADRYSTWKHPGPHTIQSVYSRGLFLQVVTSKVPSMVVERVMIG